MSEEANKDQAVFSTDGKTWADKPGKEAVTKIVIGEPGKGDEKLRLEAALWKKAQGYWDTLTHLHLWNLNGLGALPELPPGLKVLDVRGCAELTEVPELTAGLEVLVVEECPHVGTWPELAAGSLGKLDEVSLKGCAAVEETWLHGLLAAAPAVRKVDFSGCVELTALPKKLPSGLVDVRLNGCGGLRVLPEFWPAGLRRLELAECVSVEGLPNFRPALHYVNLVGTESLAELPDERGKPRTLFLYGSGLQVPPASELGEGPEENVAGKTEAYFEDVAVAGPGEVRRCKVLFLGNGGAGKTCLSLALEPGKDPKEAKKMKSTHGVRFGNWDIATAEKGVPKTVHAHLWDFGGQEIYHNTHRLFMEKGAVFVVLWHPDQDGNEAPPNAEGYADEWRPLRYWIDFIRLACPHRAEIVIVCSHRAEVDEALGGKLAEEIGEEDAKKYRLFHVNALGEDGDGNAVGQGQLDALRRHLETVVEETVQRQGVMVPSYWEIAQEMAGRWVKELEVEGAEAGTGKEFISKGEFQVALVEEMKEAIARDEAGKFDRLREALGSGSFELDDERVERTLSFLTHSGWIYWNRRLDGERVIVGQKWALEGIYAALDRREGKPVYEALKARGGRFTREDLPSEDWLARGLKERDLLISFMKLTGMCFPLVGREESYWREEVLVSLAHLPTAKEAGLEGLFTLHPDVLGAGDPAVIEDAFLHAGHWRALLASLGADYGTWGTYASDGFLLERNKEGQSVFLRYVSDSARRGLGGRIEIEVAGKEGGKLRDELRGYVAQFLPGDLGRRSAPAKPQEPGQKMAGETGKLTVFVSYTWNPWEWRPNADYEEPVNEICTALGADRDFVEIWRDKDLISPAKRDSVTAFMRRITEAQKVLLVVSEKYWESEYCMWELRELLQSFKRRSKFIEDTIVVVEHPSSQVRQSTKEKQRLIKLWEKKDDMPCRMENLVADIRTLVDQVLRVFKEDIKELYEPDGMYKVWGDGGSHEAVIKWVKGQLGLKPPTPKGE